MKIAIYARVSTDKQDNANQLEQLREFASKQSWEIVAEYKDTVSESGRRTRPHFDAVTFGLVLFPVPAHRTGQPDFPHPALGKDSRFRPRKVRGSVW